MNSEDEDDDSGYSSIGEPGEEGESSPIPGLKHSWRQTSGSDGRSGTEKENVGVKQKLSKGDSASSLESANRPATRVGLGDGRESGNRTTFESECLQPLWPSGQSRSQQDGIDHSDSGGSARLDAAQRRDENGEAVASAREKNSVPERRRGEGRDDGRREGVAKRGSHVVGVEMPHTGTGHAMMWPPPHHLHVCPAAPEPLNELKEGIVTMMATHDSKRVMNPGAVLNRVVFDSIEPNPSRNKDVDASLPADKVRQYYELSGPDDETLVFESRFESGNLRRAIQIYPSEYDLILRPDINTRGHTQWYYFSISNMRRGRRYKFNIINMQKPDSVYNQGLRPLLYSQRQAETAQIGWVRAGTDIAYYANSIRRKGGCYYTLTFTVTFPLDHDTCFLAHCYPFTYTDWKLYLQKLQADPARASRFRCRPLCQTLAGNDCDLITVTSFSPDPEAIARRKGVLLTARVHPGETQASWMLRGVLDYLTGPSLDAKLLRDNFVFKIVPILNPDGVINGNYRCSLSGQDLNRQWQDPSRTLHPTIFYTKMMLKRFQQDRDIFLYCDLHGHSRKKNIFMYGCDSAKAPPSHPSAASSARLRERIFPRLLWRNSDVFSFNDSSFKVYRAKESTARVVVWREFGVANSYTLEASFAGADFGAKAGVHMTVADFLNMGKVLCDSILDYFDPDQEVGETCHRKCCDVTFGAQTRIELVHRELLVLYPDTTEEKEANESSAGEESSSEDDTTAAVARRGGGGGKAKKGKGGVVSKGGQGGPKNDKRLSEYHSTPGSIQNHATGCPGLT